MHIPREIKTCVHRKYFTQTFIAALFILADEWKQPECPPSDDWINNMGCIHTMENHSTIKG